MLLDLMLNEGGQNDKSIMKQSELEYKKEQDEMLKKAIDESIKDTEKKKVPKVKEWMKWIYIQILLYNRL